MRDARRLSRPVVQTKRAYEAADRSDGYRVLVDRLWPRGVRKDALALDAWDEPPPPSRVVTEPAAKLVARRQLLRPTTMPW